MSTSSSRRARGLVIAWMPVSQRSATIARRLDYELLLVGRSGFQRPWSAPLTYPLLALRTIIAIVRRRPRAVVIIAPPFVAPIVAWPILSMLGARFAIDVHSGALLDRRWRWSVPALAWIARRAVVSVVTLASLRDALASRGAATMVLPDPLPALTPSGNSTERPPRQRPLVAAVCGWAADEPLEALVASAAGRSWDLVLTGRPRQDLPATANVRLAGFLEAADYVDLLAGADAIVVLTTRDQTLLSGGWEAIALGRPVVLSGTPALRATFGDDVVYVDPDADSIAAGIEAILADPGAASRVADLRERFGRANDAALEDLRTRLETRGQSSNAARSADQAR